MPLFQGIDVAGFDTSQRHNLVVDYLLGGCIPKHFWAEGGSVAFLRDAVEDWTKEYVVSLWLVLLYLFQAVARAGYALIETLGCLRTAVVEMYAVQIVRACQLEMAVQHNAVVPFVWYLVKQLATCLHACAGLAEVQEVDAVVEKAGYERRLALQKVRRGYNDPFHTIKFLKDNSSALLS